MPNKLALAALALAMATSVVGSATLALFTATAGRQRAGFGPQRFAGVENRDDRGDDSGDSNMSAGRIQVVSWRGGDDAVPADAEAKGWPAPLFYTTPLQGAYPGAPVGNKPTGLWAPGDSWQRSLYIKNKSDSFKIRAEALDAVLYGNLALAPWYQVDLRDDRGRLLHRGTLADLAKAPHPFQDQTGKTHHLSIGGHKHRTLFFTVSLSLATPNALQGETLKADLRVYVGQDRHREHDDDEDEDDRDDGDPDTGSERDGRGRS